METEKDHISQSLLFLGYMAGSGQENMDKSDNVLLPGLGAECLIQFLSHRHQIPTPPCPVNLVDDMRLTLGLNMMET